MGGSRSRPSKTQKWTSKMHHRWRKPADRGSGKKAAVIVYCEGYAGSAADARLRQRANVWGRQAFTATHQLKRKLSRIFKRPQDWDFPLSICSKTMSFWKICIFTDEKVFNTVEAGKRHCWRPENTRYAAENIAEKKDVATELFHSGVGCGPMALEN